MPRWTDEARAKQAALIRTWSPWKESTGPRTSRGKRRSAANWKKGSRGAMLQIVRAFRRAAGG